MRTRPSIADLLGKMRRSWSSAGGIISAWPRHADERVGPMMQEMDAAVAEAIAARRLELCVSTG